MKVVATFHPPSSVVGSVACHLTPDRDAHYLAVATVDRLEVFSAADDGLKLECSAEVWGRIVTLKKWPAADNKSGDTLVILTDHPDPRFVRYQYKTSNTGEATLERVNILNLAERGGARESEFLHDVIISPDGRAAIASVYTGKLKVIAIDAAKNSMAAPFDVTCQEYNLLSLAFLQLDPEKNKQSKYHIAMLYFDHEEKIRLHARELDTKTFELSPAPSLSIRPCVPSLGLKTLTEPTPFLIYVPELSFEGEGKDKFRSGVLVLGGAKIRLFEATDSRYRNAHKSDHKKSSKVSEDRNGKPKASISWPWAEVTACCSVNEEGSRYLISDAFGRVALLSLELLSTEGIVLLPLGEASPSTTLSYITNQTFFAGSHFGDSQLIRINSEALVSDTVNPPPLYGVPTVETLSRLAGASDSKGKARETDDEPGEKRKGKVIKPKGVYLDVIDTRTNIAPVLDAVLADTDGSGLPQIFTASGGKNTGSVRVIRNGADFADIARIEGAGNFTSLFPLRETCESAYDAYVLATDGLTTQLFRLGTSTDRVQRVRPEDCEFDSTCPTLAAANIRRQGTDMNGKRTYENSSWVVQVTTKSIRLIDLTFKTLLASWSPAEMGPEHAQAEIVCAGVNESQVLIALSMVGGNDLVLVGFSNKGPGLSFKRQARYPRGICALSCAPADPNQPYTLCVTVGFWDSSVEVLNLREPKQFSSYKPPIKLSALSALPRSVLLHSFSNSETYLFVGLADGSVVVCALKDDTLLDKRVFAMGAVPIGLSRYQVNGQIAVFASGSRAAIFSVRTGSLHHSPVLVKGVTAAAPFSIQGWESSVLISTKTHLNVGQVRAVNKMQIRTIPFGLDNPVRLAYEPKSRTIGVGCIRADPSPLRDIEQATDAVMSSFKVLDDTTFEVLSTYVCQAFEEIASVTTFTPPGADSRTYYAIGTMFTDSVMRDEPSSGRIILLLPRKSGSLSEILTAEVTTKVQGCVYALLCVDGHLIAAMNSAVMVFKLKEGEDAILEHVYTWNHDYIVASLAAHGRRIFNGDAVHSVSALDLCPTEDTTLRTVARNYGPLWPTAIGAWSEGTVIGSNADLNLFSFRVQTKVEGTRTVTVLERDGFFHADDVINRFIPGSLGSTDDMETSQVTPKQVFLTSTGRIGVILDMSEDLSVKMYGLHRNLAAAFSSSKDTSHTKWRTPAGARGRSDADDEARGFLDGDLLERFLDLPLESELLKKVMQGRSAAERIDMPYEQIRTVLETMQGMH